jgi:hypothetical protein
LDSLSKDKSQIWARLSEDSIISRLKEVLQVEVVKAIDYISKEDGYLGNLQMAIPIAGKKLGRHAQKYWLTKIR